MHPDYTTKDVRDSGKTAIPESGGVVGCCSDSGAVIVLDGLVDDVDRPLAL